MVDMVSIAAAVTGLKTATDIAKTMLELKAGAEIQGKVIELQGVILAAQSNALAAQSDQFTLLEKVRGLESQMAELEAWEAEKKRYELRDLGSGTFAYALKAEEARGEPSHRICAACYQKGHKSILQVIARADAEELCRCVACQSELWLGPKGR